MKGFTIIELLIVIVISAILGTIAYKGLLSDTKTWKFKESDVVCLKDMSTKVGIIGVYPMYNRYELLFPTGETQLVRVEMLEECKE